MITLRQIAWIVVLTCVALGIFAAMGATIFIASGIYDVAATKQHTAPVYWVIEKALNRSIAYHSEGIKAPDLAKPDMIATGMDLYREHCAACHGAPGVAPRTFAMGMDPVPPPLAQVGRERPPHELFWIVKNGFKMTGMPAWIFKLDDDQIWSVVAFLKQLPTLTPADYKAAAEKRGPAGKPMVESAR